MSDNGSLNMRDARDALSHATLGYCSLRILCEVLTKMDVSEAMYRSAVNVENEAARCAYYLLDYHIGDEADLKRLPDYQLYLDVPNRAEIEAVALKDITQNLRDVRGLTPPFDPLEMMGVSGALAAQHAMLVIHYCDEILERDRSKSNPLYPFERACFISASASARKELEDWASFIGADRSALENAAKAQVGTEGTYSSDWVFLARCQKSSLEEAANAHSEYKNMAESMVDKILGSLFD